MSSEPAKLVKGARLGDYEIQSLLGSGGMGEVYRARDTRLQRDVAIKVLPSSFASDPDRLRRFEQEATAAAALNHPNILAVYQMGTLEGAPYLVSELLEGETLRDEIQRGPLAFRKVLEYGSQIARGLAAAHEKGIVHRDLKPENLFVTKDGRVKILDFGLAKLTQPQAHSTDTITAATDAGIVMGTAGYMAPEQVRGETAGHRADIFAFGAILYEMLAGKRAFAKPTSAETMASILKDELPEITQLAPSTPPALQRVVHRCLEKNAERRFQSASDLAFALEALSDSGGAAAVTGSSPAQPGRPNWQRIAALALLIVAVAAFSIWLSSAPRPPRVLATTQLTHDGVPKFSVLTDGTRLYLGEIGAWNRIVQVSVNGGETSPVLTPFSNSIPLDLSADRTKLLIGSHVGTEARTPVWSLPLPSGAPRHLVDVVNSTSQGSAAWSPDGQLLVFGKESEVYLANADGSSPRKLATVPGSPSAFTFSPDSKRIRFTLQKSDVTYSLWEIRRDGKDLRPVFVASQSSNNTCCGGWSPDGRYFLFVSRSDSGGNIWMVREPHGLFRWRPSEPMPLTSGPLSFDAWALSVDSKKLFVVASQARAELVRYDPNSKEFVPFLSGISAGELDYSRDGQWVTYVSYPDKTLWRSRADGSDQLQLTFPPMAVGLPRFSPDGSQIACIASQPGGLWRAVLIPREGGTPLEVLASTTDQADPSWSADGKKLAIGRLGAAENGPIQIVDLATHQVSSLPGSENFFSPRWSPDGQFIAALNAESTKLLLFNLKTQTWSDWITEPGALGFINWSQDGKYFYYDSAFTEHQTFRRVKLGETHSEFVNDLKGFLGYKALPAFGWSGLAPDGSALFTRDLSTDEVYALDVDLP